MKRLPQTEFIALMAMLAATVAFSIDAMLPAFTEITAELAPGEPHRVGLIITSFILGMGLGTFFTGPLSDAYGRKPVMVGGAIVYIFAAGLAYFAPTLEWMLVARVLAGIGAAGPRVAAMAMTRDLYAGRDMARILSFIMMVFTLVPAFAPTLGAIIVASFGWRSIFLAFMVFSAATAVWLILRQPETLRTERRNRVTATTLIAGTKEMFSHPTARLSVFVQTLALGMIYTVLSTTQPIFDEVYGWGDTFHLWFGGIAIVSGTSAIVNSQLVVRLGMRTLIKFMFGVQIAFSMAMIVVLLLEVPTHIEFIAYLIWTTSVFFQAGMTIGNLNALGMEPMGHIAGIAASIMSATSTILGVVIAAPISLAYNGSAMPTAVGILLCAIAARLLTGWIRRDSD